MAHVLKLTDDDGNEITLTSSPYILEQYTPASGELDLTSISEPVNALTGNGIDMISRANVTESIRVAVYDESSKVNMQTYVRDIETFLERAHFRQINRSGPRVWLTLRVDGESSTWRTEILSGQFVLDQDALPRYFNVMVVGEIVFTRRPYFEEEDLSEIPLKTNSQATYATGGRNITGDANNWAEWQGTAIDGSLPAPAVLRVYNNTGSNQAWRNYYIGSNTFNDPENFQHQLTSSDLGQGMISSTVSWSSTNASYISQQVRYALPTNMVGDINGSYCRVIAFLSAKDFPAYTTARVIMSVTISSVPIAQWYGPEISVCDSSGNNDKEVLDLGSVPIPPGGKQPGITMNGIELGIGFFNASTTSGSATFERIQVVPLSTGFRRLYQTGFSLVNNTYVADDPYSGVSYGSGGYDIVRTYENPVMVYPDKPGRIYVMVDKGDTSWTSGQAMKARMYYRKRRLTI